MKQTNKQTNKLSTEYRGSWEALESDDSKQNDGVGNDLSTRKTPFCELSKPPKANSSLFKTRWRYEQETALIATIFPSLCVSPAVFEIDLTIDLFLLPHLINCFTN